ncbi:coiled-coil protein [Sarcoptes scabiei]|nr:coiled-coil protein [Sarcoptes scabiei]
MGLIPTFKKFCEKFIFLAEKIRCEDGNQVFYHFSYIVSNLNSIKENLMIEFLLDYHHSISNEDETHYFISPKQFTNFFCGIVHYCPRIILNQLFESDDRKRFKAVLLLKSTISFFVSNNYSLNIIFNVCTKNSSEYSSLILNKFLDCFNDRKTTIRSLFIETSLVLLSCSSEIIDSKFKKRILWRVCDRCLYDPNLKIQSSVLDLIENIAHYKPVNIFYDVTFETLIKSSCSEIQDVRLLTQEKLASIYVDLFLHYPKEIYNLPNIGKLAGILQVRLNLIRNQVEKNTEKIHLENLMRLIHDFLVEKERIS